MEHNYSLPNPTGPAGLPPVARRARFVVAGVRQRAVMCQSVAAPARRAVRPGFTRAGGALAWWARSAHSAPSLRACGAGTGSACGARRAGGARLCPARTAGRAGPLARA